MDQGTRNNKALTFGLLVLLMGGGSVWYLSHGTSFDLKGFRPLALLIPSCEQPIEYQIGTFDERFGISRTEFVATLEEAALLWNTAAGKTVVVAGTGNTVSVNLVYSDQQKNAQLGQSIDTEQESYEQKRDEVEGLRATYLALRARFETQQASFARATAAYDTDVAYWNARGGAPPAEYARLENDAQALKRQQQALNARAAEVNEAAAELNFEVEILNRLAARTNAKVGVYNKNAGTDFDQGTYTEDRDGKRIDIFEFTNRTELKRVLAHEFGHALGIGHVENPDSIMYSYNIGTSFVLSPEDKQALSEVCGVE